MPKIIRHFGDKTQSLEMLKTKFSGFQTENELIKKSRLIMAEQTHSDIVVEVTFMQAGAGFTCAPIPHADALVTTETNLFLAVKTADCIPILIYEKSGQAFAAVHAGRMGVQLNIVEKVVKALCIIHRCKPENLMVEIGPAITAEHYPVDEVTFNEFVIATKTEQIFPKLDLKKVIRKQLASLRIPDGNISNLDICTFEDENYFSYREDGTKERQLAVIGMLSEPGL